METSTCIVAVKQLHNKTSRVTDIVMGSDSAGVDGGLVIRRADRKLFCRTNSKGEYLIFGCTSSFRMIQLLRYNLSIPDQKSDSDLYYMTTVFIDEVRKCLKQGGYMKVENNEETGGTFIVAYKREIYIIDNDFQVGICYDPYMAIGCGRNYAIAAIYGAVNYMKNAWVLAEIALSAAEFYNPGGISKPFYYESLHYPEAQLKSVRGGNNG